VELVKNTDLEALWAEAFEPASPLYAISQWTDDEHSYKGINRYFLRRGLEGYTVNIILHAIKDQLTTGHYDEARILEFYCRKKCYDEAQDRNRATLDSLDGNYIPFDLEDCFRDLDNLLDDTSKQTIIGQSAHDFVINSHIHLGTYLRNRWQLWGFSRLFFFFYKQGLCDPETMSDYILGEYNKYLKGQKVVKYPNTNYCDSVDKVEQLELRRKSDSAYASFRLKDTVRFKFTYGYIDDRQKDSVWDDCEATGLIIARNDTRRELRIRILSTCSKNGIILDDNKSVKIYDPATKQWRKPAKRKKIYARKGDVVWTRYRHWEKTAANKNEGEY
jgi:hypothetical protein